VFLIVQCCPCLIEALFEDAVDGDDVDVACLLGFRIRWVDDIQPGQNFLADSLALLKMDDNRRLTRCVAIAGVSSKDSTTTDGDDKRVKTSSKNDNQNRRSLKSIMMLLKRMMLMTPGYHGEGSNRWRACDDRGIGDFPKRTRLASASRVESIRVMKLLDINQIIVRSTQWI